MKKSKFIKNIEYKGISSWDWGAIFLMFISAGFVTIKGLLEILGNNKSKLFAFAIMCVGFAFLWLKLRILLGWWEINHQDENIISALTLPFNSRK